MASTLDRENMQQAALSMTAVSVALAFHRAFELGYGGEQFDEREKRVYQHMASAALASLPKTSLNGALFSALGVIPSARCQKIITNYFAKKAHEEHVLLRRLLVKQTITDQIINQHVKQVIFIGGGFDARSMLAAEANSSVQFFELDRGLTRDAKIKAMYQLPLVLDESISMHMMDDGTLKIRENLQLIECDFGDMDVYLEAVLNHYGFDKNENTLVILEGFTMYLDDEANQKLLATLQALLSPESTIVLSYFDTLSGNGMVASAAYKSSSETFKFALLPEHVLSYARKYEFGVMGKFSTVDELDRFGPVAAENATYYKNHPEARREIYYTLSKSSLDRYTSIEKVPTISISGEVVDLSLEVEGRCNCGIQ